MPRLRNALPAAAACLALLGCASASSQPGSGRPVDEHPGEGEGEGEGGGTADAGDAGDARADGALPPPGQRGFLEPCDGNPDCLSGYCVHFGAETVCSRTCADEDCPLGWSCKGVTNAGADLTFVCAPLSPTLCEPCRRDSDCGPLAVDLCLVIDGEHRCGWDCSDGRRCPEFYECVIVDPEAPAPQPRQCMPTSGRCGCTPDEVGQTRPCFVENLHGVCDGVETCQPEAGWTNCTANVPWPEECDGIDNDCDGLVDEELDGQPCQVRSAFGVCPGVATCTPDRGTICDGPEPALEVCDGIDNDCNGEIDDGLCFDGNPCTDDDCDPETGCVYPPLAGPCDDQTVCTLDDHCVDGRCTGSPVDCDDENPCTDDRCDPVAGCRSSNNNARCQTGDPCTADYCEGGECRRGGQIDCEDGNVCTDHRCDPARGCVTTPADGRPCDDDDPCTSRSVCGGNECVSVEQFCTSECPCILFTCIPLGDWPICTCLCP